MEREQSTVVIGYGKRFSTLKVVAAKEDFIYIPKKFFFYNRLYVFLLSLPITLSGARGFKFCGAFAFIDAFLLITTVQNVSGNSEAMRRFVVTLRRDLMEAAKLAPLCIRLVNDDDDETIFVSSNEEPAFFSYMYKIKGILTYASHYLAMLAIAVQIVHPAMTAQLSFIQIVNNSTRIQFEELAKKDLDLPAQFSDNMLKRKIAFQNCAKDLYNLTRNLAV